jgi:thiol-disulfide isomerase/thioredoxin
MSIRHLSPVIGGLAGLVSVVSAAPVWAQAPDLASATARTIQVKTAQWGILPYRQGEQPTPIQHLSTTQVQYDRTGRARIDELERKNAPAKYTPALLVSDGKTQYEVLGVRGQYVKSDAPPATDGIQSKAGLANNALALALGWKNGEAEKYTAVPDETVDGKALKVYKREYAVNGKDRVSIYQFKLWVDPATKLPVRHSMFIKNEDNVMEVSRSEFSEWKLNAPIEPARFTWTPPATMAEFKEAKRPPLLAVGTPAPDFTIPKWGGGDLNLAAYRGKIVILDFWATWCGPCQMSMPHVEEMYKATKDKDVVVLGVCVWDTKEAYDAWVPKNQSKYTFTFGFDPAGRGAKSIASSLYQVSGIPTTYVIDREGKVAAALVGFNAGGDTRLAEALGKLGIDVPKPEPKSVASTRE